MSAKVKKHFSTVAVLLATLICAAGVWSAPENIIQGRDLVAGNGSGAVPIISGEDLLGAASMPDLYSWPNTPVTLRGASTHAGDAGYLVAWGVDSSYAEQVDSVLIAGLSEKTFAGRWRYVRRTEWHDDTANLGELRAYHGSFTKSDSLLAVIEIGRGASSQAVYMQPANRSRLLPLSARITYAYPGTHEVDGRVSLLERQPGGVWIERDGWNFFADMPVEFVSYEVRRVWESPPGTQYRVASGLSPANTRLDVDARIEFGVQ